MNYSDVEVFTSYSSFISNGKPGIDDIANDTFEAGSFSAHHLIPKGVRDNPLYKDFLSNIGYELNILRA